MKSNRQAVILEIISTEAIETQNQLMHALELRGIHTTQATLSRDIRDMHLNLEAPAQNQTHHNLHCKSTTLKTRRNRTFRYTYNCRC